MTCRANSDRGLGLDPGIVEIALTDRARAATEQASPRGNIGTRGPLYQNPGRIRHLAVLRQPQITPPLTTKAWLLVKAALARWPDGQFRRTWSCFDEPDNPRLGRVVAHRKPLASVDIDAGAAFHEALRLAAPVPRYGFRWHVLAQRQHELHTGHSAVVANRGTIIRTEE